jgi:UDP-N-acetylmuramoyl-tripeptide--D-alanyl-D-alanine ligase
MKSFVQKTLAGNARRVVAREKPEIIGITGSVGKSSTKEAIAAVLRRKFSVRANVGNMNTEFGLPLTVLGLPSVGDRSATKWLGTLWRGWKAAALGTPDYPKTLVLEMGADRQGDIALLCDIAPPRVGVVTAVGESHLESFGSVDAIQKEKRILVERLPKDGLAVLNRDDDRVWAMASRSKAPVRSFGFHESADVRAVEPIGYACTFDGECGMHFKVQAQGATVPMFVPGVLGRPAIYAALAAAAVGLHKGMNLVEVADGLREFSGPPGRMRYVPGIKRSVLIDDTYNAAPRSALEALYVLRDIPATEAAKKFAVLGDMLELGSLSDEGHMKVGREAAECADTLVFVGERMNGAKKAAYAAGATEDRVFHFATPAEAGRFVQERMRQNDIILVKGSRGMRMEAVVKELMADPLSAPRVLVAPVEE